MFALLTTAKLLCIKADCTIERLRHPMFFRWIMRDTLNGPGAIIHLFYSYVYAVLQQKVNL